jgi:hypothetical protein
MGSSTSNHLVAPFDPTVLVTLRILHREFLPFASASQGLLANNLVPPSAVTRFKPHTPFLDPMTHGNSMLLHKVSPSYVSATFLRDFQILNSVHLPLDLMDVGPRCSR